MGKVSIIIPNWNGMPVLADCLESIDRCCARLDYEIIVIDNASTDNSCIVIKQNFPRVRLIRNDRNCMFAGPTNQGADRASGDFLFLLNNDVILEDGCLEILMEVLEKDNQIGAAAPQLRYSDGRIQSTCRYFPTFKNLIFSGLRLENCFPDDGWKMKNRDHNAPGFVQQPMMSALLIRRDCWQNTGPLDERFPLYFNDVDWCYRAWQKGWKIFFEPGAKAVHLEAWTGRKLGFRQIRFSSQGLYRYFRKHHIRLFSPEYPLLLALTGGLVGIWIIRRLVGRERAVGE